MAESEPVDVTFVVPVLNEERYVRATVESILAQRGVGQRQIVLVRGRSTDGTDAVLEELAEAHPVIEVIDNPDNAISIGMNKGFAAARHAVVVRVDAHSVLPADYTSRMVHELRRRGAVNVGGRMRAEGTASFQCAVAWGYNSREGLGGGVYHLGGEPGPAESAYLGVFNREAVLTAGGFDEGLSRGEDWELNLRLRNAGGLVWFVPDIEVVYRPRDSVHALLRQFLASGRWRGELIRRSPGHSGVRYLIPPLFVLALVSVVVAAAVAAASSGETRTVFALVAAAPLVAYGGWVLSAVLRARDLEGAARTWLLVVLPLMHVSWGVGCLLGLVRPSRGLNAFSGR